MNQDMNEMREQIFQEYRDSIQKHRDLSLRYEEAVEKIRNFDTQRNEAYDEMTRLKELIEIMITEDCDPVMAKLRYSEKLSDRSKVEYAEVAYSDSYISGRASNLKSLSKQANTNGRHQSLIKSMMRAINGRS